MNEGYDLNKKRLKKMNPQIKEHQLEEFAKIVTDAMTDNLKVEIVEFSELEDKSYVGYINNIDKQIKTIKIQCANEIVWIPLIDIVSIKFVM